MAETNQQGLVKTDIYNGEDRSSTAAATANDYVGDIKAQAQEYGQKFQEAAVKAKDFAAEKFQAAGGKLKELQNKNPQELVEEAKDYARKKPGEALLISAAVGLVIGLLLKGRR